MSTPNDIYNTIYNTAEPPRTDTNTSTGTGQQQTPHTQYNSQQYNSQPNYSQRPVPPLPPIYIQQPRVGCAGYLFRFATSIFLFFAGCIIMILLIGAMVGAFAVSLEDAAGIESKLSEKFIGGVSTAKAKIAVITISGIITESEDGFVPKQIKQALKDKEVKGIVLRVDSPGGTMTGSDYYLYLLKKLKEKRNLPVAVSMGSTAASGGYYVSMCGDEIFAEPTTITGSIGVIVPMYKGVGLCEKIGIESTPVTSGPLKTMGSFDKPLTAEQRAVWQNLVDDNFARFKKVIRECRSAFDKEPEKLDKLATGQIYTANEAVSNGLIDKIGYLDDAVEAVRKKTGLSEHKAIRYRSKTSVSDMFSIKAPETVLSMKNVFNMTVPKVYLLVPGILPIVNEQ
jgi:protease-4